MTALIFLFILLKPPGNSASLNESEQILIMSRVPTCIKHIYFAILRSIFPLTLTLSSYIPAIWLAAQQGNLNIFKNNQLRTLSMCFQPPTKPHIYTPSYTPCYSWIHTSYTYFSREPSIL